MHGYLDHGRQPRVGLLRRIREDIQVVLDKDPAATSTAEVLLYPHLHALWLHRLAHAAYRRGRRLTARALSMYGRFISSGIEIHPGATLGRRLFVDHGAGVVIGETAEVGNDVMLYHGVTLGSVGWWHDLAKRRGKKRHPTIGDHVVLGTGASVLGPVVVGEGSKVGAHAVVLVDLPSGSRVPAGTVVQKLDVRRPGASRDLPPAVHPSPNRGATTMSDRPGSSRTSGHVLITCAPPNPNGDLHIGHLSGPFLGADVLRRYLRARQVPVTYVSYTDDESCYVPRRAAELGLAARETAFVFTRRIEQTLSLADMLPDYYAHPHREPRHQQTVQQQFLRLYRAGMIEDQCLPTPYCEACQRFLYEADLRGRCRFCRVPCDGTYCEDCGFPQDPQGAEDVRCVRCGDVPVERPSHRLVIPLATYANRLEGLYQRRNWPRRVGTFCRELLAYGLPDTPISRVSRYGVPVPLAGWDGHILDTWFSGIYGYMAATEGLGAALGEPELAEQVWSDQDTTLVHFIGFDCSFSHAVLWPAMLLAADAPVLPRHIISNEFYHLEGEKFSTSRGHAIWGSDFLREVPVDAMRFHLSRTNPEAAPANFSRAEFDECRDDFLGGQLEGWAGSLFELLHRDHDSTVPDVAWTDRPLPVRRVAERLPQTVGDTLEPATFSLRRAAQAITEAVEWAAADLRSVRGGATVDAGALAGHAELLAVVAAVAAPLMPTWSARTWDQLRIGHRPVTGGLPWPEPELRLVPPGATATPSYQTCFQVT